MLLTPEDAERFFRLHRSLLGFVNQQREVIPEVATVPEGVAALPPEDRVAVRNAWLEDMTLLDRFVENNPDGLGQEDLDIVRSWKHLVAGRFFLFRQLKRHAVFLSTEEPVAAYGVLGLTESFEAVIASTLPRMVEAVLLPFGDRIVYDGHLNTFNITLGGGIKRSLNESYKQAKERQGGVLTSLPPQPKPATKTKSPKKSRPKTRRPSSAEVRPFLEAIVGLTDEFCREYLDEEYATLCRQLTEKLARKRPSPLTRGKPPTWAAGIVRTIAWVNFLHDSSQTPHMRLCDIDAVFGIAESTGAAKLKGIRTMLRIRQLDPDWTLPSRLEDNPLVWMLNVGGLPMDARHAPREVQATAYEKGLIPYIPADQGSDG